MRIEPEYYMKAAIALAGKGLGYTSPNPLVGAVVVRDGRIVGKGFHEAAGKAHAEVNAIEEAGEACRGADLYVTLEPCNHHGRTPPCTERIIRAGIKRVFVGAMDPNPDVAGGGAGFLRENGLEVETGLCEAEAKRLVEIFAKHATTGRPFVILKCASTMDGRIATRTGDSKWITGGAARNQGHMLRHAVDGIMVGAGTVLADNPSLTARPAGMAAPRDPERFVLDSKLSLPLDSNIFSLKSHARTHVICGVDAPLEKKGEFEAKGVNLITAPPDDSGFMDMKSIMEILGGMGVTGLLIEGGGRIAASALAADIVDKVCFFYAPKILGADDGIPIFYGNRPGPELMGACRGITGATIRRFGEDLLVEGYL